VNESSISTYYILDLDRTIFDTVKATILMEGVVALHDASLAASLGSKFEETNALGESFSIRDFIAESVGEEETLKIQEKYKAAAIGQDLLMPGARELMAYIHTLEHDMFGIMTYGSPLGQAMKIQAAGLGDVPTLITQETFKGAEIATWRQADGLYHMPTELGGVTAKEIVFIDDKPFSFKGLPVDCRGYLVKSVFDAGIEKIPTAVVPVSSLSEIISAEKARLTP